MTDVTTPPASVAGGTPHEVSLELSARQTGMSFQRTRGLIYAESKFPVSFTLAVAILLLPLGVAAIASVVFHTGPLG